MENKSTQQGQAGNEDVTSEVTKEAKTPDTLDSVLEKSLQDSPETSEDSKKEATEEGISDNESKEVKEDSVKKDEVKQPPQDWSEGEKKLFNKLEDEDKTEMLNTWANWQKGYNKKFEEVAEQRKRYEKFDATLKPRMEQIKANGVEPETYLNNLMNIDKFATEKPKEFAAWYLKNQGIDPQDLVQTEDIDPVQSEIRSVKDSLGNEINTLRSQIDQQNVQKLQNTIEEFKNTKDDSGNLKYPDFDKLRDSMAEIYKTTGEDNLEKLYNKAVRQDDELFEKIVAERVAKDIENKQKEAIVSKAKKASTTITNSANTVSTKKVFKNIDEAIFDAMK